MTTGELSKVNARLSENDYRSRFSWDKATWSSHCGNCLANCPYKLYSNSDGAVFEEVAGVIPGFEGIPDMNPLGCQKGAAWQKQLTSKDRITKPLKRVGERGSGNFEEIGYQQAYDLVADAIIDSIEKYGTDSILLESGAECGVLASVARNKLALSLGAIHIDPNSSVSDVHAGHWLTFGNLLGGSSADDTFRAETVIIWNGNPAFTRIPFFHYLTEARYRGANIITVAPDYSPSSMHSDLYVPIVPGTDAQFILGVCNYLIQNNLFDRNFVASQTDLTLLVDTRTKRFLRQSDMVQDGKEDRFYGITQDGVTLIDASKLDSPFEPSDFLLEAQSDVKLLDGTTVNVTTVFNLLKERLSLYTPESVYEICQISKDVLIRFANLVAGHKTKVSNGLGSCKHYHGDLMERSMDLLLALTGNWGKPGTGLDTYIIALLEGEVLSMFKTGEGVQAGEEAIEAVEALLQVLQDANEATSPGKAYVELMRMGASLTNVVPPALYFYHHGGFKEDWDKKAYGDSPKTLGEIINEAEANGWWEGLVRPANHGKTKVMLVAGTNILRRTRGGQRNLLESLYKDLDLAVTVDFRMNTTGMYSDIILPISCEGERIEMHAANSHSFERSFSDKAFDAPNGVPSEWEVFDSLAKAVARRAKERNLDSFTTTAGVIKPYADIQKALTSLEERSDEAALDEILRDSALTGNIESGTSLYDLRQKGFVKPVKLPDALEFIASNTLKPDEPFVAYENHLTKGVIFETLTGRAQFYIDHEWFIDSGENLPCYKPTPKMAGDYPFRVTGGHPRWSIHATNTTSEILLETTRGKPVAHLNPTDADELGILDGAKAVIFNDYGELQIEVKLSPSVRPKQVIVYASWEPQLFENWKDMTFVEPGPVKWLHFVTGYGHLVYTPMQWQPAQSDRVYEVGIKALN